MSPKSRIYNLVMSWRNKPFRELRDIEQSDWQNATSKGELGDLEGAGSVNLSQNPYRGTHYEPIFNLPGSSLKGVLYRPLMNANANSILRHCLEGIDAIHYWQCSNRIIPLILPINTESLQTTHFVDALCDLVLNSRLPIGLINIGLLQKPTESIAVIQGITRLHRLGVLFHWLNFDGDLETVKLIVDFQFEAVHLHSELLRKSESSQIKTLIEQINSFKKWGCKIGLSHVTFVHDNEIAYQLGIDYCYGSLMLTPVSRHQIINVQDSRIGKALFSIQTTEKPKPQGDL